MSTQSHWDSIYGGRMSEELGWYEPVPATLDLVRRHSRPGDSVIDVGAGDSGLADELFRLGYTDITLLDISEVALERSRTRWKGHGHQPSWIQADVTTWAPRRRWDLWHDRAAFHFLTDDEDRAAYRATARAALVDRGRLIVAAFGPDGPTSCAGLPVERYDPDGLVAAFGPEFSPVEVVDLPPPDRSVGDQRPYLAAVLRPARSSAH